MMDFRASYLLSYAAHFAGMRFAELRRWEFDRDYEISP